MNVRERLLTGLPVTDERLAVRGVTTAVLAGGDGPPMVLLHGAGGFAAQWVSVLPELVRGHRVMAPDLPGHGATGPADDVLGWLTELIDRSCAQAPVVVGSGLGGSIAARLACRQPHRFAALVLVGSLGLDEYAPAPGFAAGLARFTEQPSAASREDLFTHCFADLDRVRARLGERWTALADYALEGARTPGRAARLAAMMSRFGLDPVPSADLDRIAVPTILIWGRHDLQVLLATAQAAGTRHGWPLHVIEDAGDEPALERPDAFLAALSGALAAAGPAVRDGLR